jgi:O-antigen/teichoic acid export membrane protein
MDDPGGQSVPEIVGAGQVRHFARQSALLVSSGFVSYAGAFGLNVLLARALGPSRFGAWFVAFATARAIAVIGLAGADWILLRQGSFYEGAGDLARLRRTLYLALALASCALLMLGGLLFGISSILGRTVFHSQSMVPLLRVAAALGPLMGLGQLMLYGTKAFKTMRDAAVIGNVVQPMARLAFVGVALLLIRSPLSALVGALGAELALTGMSTLALHRRLPLVGPTASIEGRELVGFAVPVSGIRLLESARAQVFPILLGSLATLSASAAYAASARIAVAPSAVIAALNQVYTPMASDLYLSGRRQELRVLFKTMGKWSFTLGFPLFCLQVAFPKEILTIFGASFRGASLALIVLAIGMLFNFGTGPVTSTLILAGRPRLALLDYVVTFGAEIGIGAWLIPSQGVLGAAIAYTVGIGINNLLPLLQTWLLDRLHPYRFDYWKPVLAGVVAVVGAKLLVRGLDLGPGIPTAAFATAVVAAVYSGLVLWFGLNEHDRAAIDALFGRVRRRSMPVQPDTGTE